MDQGELWMEADRMTIEIPVLHCSTDPCPNHQWWSCRENGPGCSIFSNEAIRRAVWMEIRLSFAVPQGNEWDGQNRGKLRDNGLFAPPLIPFSPEASRPPAKIDQSREPPLLSIKINWETPQHQKYSIWENSKSCEDNLVAYVAIQPNRDQAGKRQKLQTRLCPLGSLLLQQGQSLKCLILNKSKHYIWEQSLRSKKCLCSPHWQDTDHINAAN